MTGRQLRRETLQRLAEWHHNGCDDEPGAFLGRAMGPVVELELGYRVAEVILCPRREP